MKMNTKSKLISSLLVLVLCVTAFAGSTYAWFSETVVSGSNLIQSGNLDVVLQYKTNLNDEWADVTGDTKLFKEGALYEPGYTEVVFLRVANAGSLALKYDLKVNVTGEKTSTNVFGEEFALSDYLKVGYYSQDEYSSGFNYADILLPTMFGSREAALQNVADTMGKLEDVVIKSAGPVLPEKEGERKTSQVIALVLTMPEDVENEANHMTGVEAPTINLGVILTATQLTDESDSFDNQYDKDATGVIVVDSAEAAQAAFDEANSGATIQLMPGVDYGTLEVRANVGSVDKKPVALNGNTEAVDHFPAKYPTGEFTRKLDNITIVGAPGAKVDGIKFVTGTFKVDIPETGKQSGTMYQWVEINNLVIDSVEFTDASTLGASTRFVSPIFMDLQSVEVNGLTVKNCTLEGNNEKMNFVYAYGSAAKDCDFGVTLNNVNISNNTVSGIARLCELREAENVTIQGNNVADLTREVALLSNNAGYAYSGNIEVTGNNADNIATDYAADGEEGLFFRVGVGGDANIVVKDNVITNSGCVESSFVGVTNHTGTLTVENNTLS